LTQIFTWEHTFCEILRAIVESGGCIRGTNSSWQRGKKQPCDRNRVYSEILEVLPEPCLRALILIALCAVRDAIVIGGTKPKSELNKKSKGIIGD